MRQRLVSLSALGLIVLLGILAIARSDAGPGVFAAPFAQQASPEASPDAEAVLDAAAGLPADVEVELLASVEQVGLPSNGLVIRLERIALDDDIFQVDEQIGNALIVVEAGSVSIETADSTTELEGGGQQYIPAGSRYSIRFGEDGGIVMRLTLGMRVESASPVAGSQSSPVAGAVPHQLLEGNANRLVARRGTLFLVRVTLPPGASTGKQVFSGPVGVFVESGAVTVENEGTTDLSVEEGGSAFLSGFTASNVTNPGDEPAVLLVAGLLAPPRGGADGPTRTPTPSTNALATSEALVADLSNDVATLTEQQIELEQTITAQQTAISEADSARATAETALTAVAVESEAGAATAESDLASVQTDLAVAQTQVAAGEAALATAEAEAAALSDELATVQAAASAAASDASSAEGASAQEITSLEATIVALQTSVAEAESSQATTESTVAALQTTGAGQSADLGAANATVEAQQTANANLTDEQASAEAQIATTIANDVATATAQANAITAANADATAQAQAAASAEAEAEASLSAAEGTAQALATALAESEANATAAAATAAANSAAAAQSATTEANEAATEQAQIVATAEAEADASVAAAEASAQILATALSESEADASAVAVTASADAAEAAGTASAAAAAADATITAQSEAAAAAAATASAVAASADATIVAQTDEISALEESLAGNIGDLADANATIAALTTAVAESQNVAGASVDPEYVDLSIQVDLEGLVNGDETAVQEAEAALDAVLQPYAGCRAAIVLTFGHGATIGGGTQLAAAVNQVIQAEQTEIFDGAAFDAFGDLTPPLGQVDLRIYFFTGCEPAPVDAVTPETT